MPIILLMPLVCVRGFVKLVINVAAAGYCGRQYTTVMPGRSSGIVSTGLALIWNVRLSHSPVALVARHTAYVPRSRT